MDTRRILQLFFKVLLNKNLDLYIFFNLTRNKKVRNFKQKKNISKIIYLFMHTKYKMLIPV